MRYIVITNRIKTWSCRFKYSELVIGWGTWNQKEKAFLDYKLIQDKWASYGYTRTSP